MEGSRSSKPSTKWTPIELGPYDASTYKAGKPYITAVLSSYAPNISIGDGKVYSSSKRKRRSIGNIICKNVALKANTEYLIFQRAYVSKVRSIIFLLLYSINLEQIYIVIEDVKEPLSYQVLFGA